MDANITVMFVIKKTNKNVSSYLFDDKILGWAAKENSKKRFKSNQDLWTYKVLIVGQIRRLIKIEKIKKQTPKLLLIVFLNLQVLKKLKYYFL